MFESRGSRFILEVLFLLVLAAVLAFADLSALEIAGVMLLGWVIVAALEWASWRNDAHFGSGLPPRYYVPTVNLPPAQPLEQVPAGYPGSQRDEAPTWIASPALRAEVLGEWPVAAPPTEIEEPVPPDDEPVDPWTVVELPAVPAGDVAAEIPEPEPVPDLAPDPEPQPVVDTFVAQLPEPEPEADLVEHLRPVHGIARYSLDPLGDPPPRRRFGRGPSAAPSAVEVPARPGGIRALPGRSGTQD